jgi:hypothetical protein
MGKWIKNPDFDVWMGIDGSDGRVPASNVVVIYEDADTNASIGSLDQPKGENAARGVGLPDVVLQVQTLLRHSGHGDAIRKCRTSFADKGKARLSRVHGSGVVE